MAKSRRIGSHALAVVRHFFPKVAKVTDADVPLKIEVTDSDNKSSQVRNHNACAMAVACKRQLKADGIIVSVSTLYAIKGNEAFRYQLPSSVSREVVSFDRKAGFAPGTYHIKPAPHSARLGAVRDPNDSGSQSKPTGAAKKRYRHLTEGIRAALGSKTAPDGIRRSQS